MHLFASEIFSFDFLLSEIRNPFNFSIASENLPEYCNDLPARRRMSSATPSLISIAFKKNSAASS